MNYFNVMLCGLWRAAQAEERAATWPSGRNMTAWETTEAQPTNVAVRKLSLRGPPQPT